MKVARHVLARGYGVPNVEHSVPVSSERVFHIASVSEDILAGVVVRLGDQNRLRLDDDLTKYIPQAPTQARRFTMLLG